MAWARSLGVLRHAGVECTGSYGAALTRHLRAEGIEVTEVTQPDKAARRRHGKTDAIDAEAAARAVLSGRATAAAKTTDGPVEMLRLFKLAKGSAIKSRTQAINQLKSVLVCADAELRESLAGLSNPKLFKQCAALAQPEISGPAGAARHPETAGPPYSEPDRGDQRPEQADNRRDHNTYSWSARRPRRRPGHRGCLAHLGRRQP